MSVSNSGFTSNKPTYYPLSLGVLELNIDTMLKIIEKTIELLMKTFVPMKKTCNL